MSHTGSGQPSADTKQTQLTRKQVQCFPFKALALIKFDGAIKLYCISLPERCPFHLIEQMVRAGPRNVQPSS